jgi:Bacterial capsule synthesis protein PGA_cap
MKSREPRLRGALVIPAIALVCASGASASSARTKPPVTPPATLLFDDTCTPGLRLTIAAVGDLLFHDALQLQAYRPGATFRQFWGPVASVLAGADTTYGNLESPIAAGVRPGGVAHKDPGRVLDRVVYGRKGDALIFNVHPSSAVDLKASGFTILSTANNHAADRGPLGMDRTLEALTAAGLAHTGARARGATTPWHTRTTAKGITLAWLACTYGLNGMPDPHNQVLQCHRDRDAVLDEVRTLSSDVTVDAVIVTPHWGEENQHRPMGGSGMPLRP